MMINSLARIKSFISNNVINIPGIRFNRKIVVFESDDWGSIRMPSKEVYSNFLKRGFNVAGSEYNRLDSLESNSDLEFLFEILHTYQDSIGNKPVFTANCVVGNPDFKKIQETDFMQYVVEPVTETFQAYPDRDRVHSLWKQGDAAGIFHPQFHGREHVNVKRWMEALRKQSPEILFTFENKTTFSGDGDYNFMEVLDYNTKEDLHDMKRSLVEGLDLFEDLFGFRSKSFIPPTYTWSSDIEEVLHQQGVRYIQGIVVQLVPKGSFGDYDKKYHFMGSSNSLGQYYIIRNVFFEPSLNRSTDSVHDCLRRIDYAFKWNKPAVIGTHRINYIGSLDEKNRSQNLRLLNELLSNIIKRWPDVEFMTSDQLGDLIAKER